LSSKKLRVNDFFLLTIGGGYQNDAHPIRVKKHQGEKSLVLGLTLGLILVILVSLRQIYWTAWCK
jgi:hypothetical protein